jgi:hypothetical protein
VSLISERAAAEILARRRLGREQARLLLLTGAAGQGVRVGTATCYELERVHALTESPRVDERRLARECPHGVHVARLGRSRAFSCGWTWERQVLTLAHQPAMTPMTHALALHLPITMSGGLPWVATVSGFVVFAATATAAHQVSGQRGGGATSFELAPAGEWAAMVVGRWFPTGTGRHWCSWQPARLTQ